MVFQTIRVLILKIPSGMTKSMKHTILQILMSFTLEVLI